MILLSFWLFPLGERVCRWKVSRNRPVLPPFAKIMKTHHGMAFLLVAMVTVFLPAPGFSIVFPQEVMVLVNENDSDSVELGTFYMEQRGIPPKNHIELDLPTTESMSREEYEEELLRPVKNMLTEEGLVEHIRVLVTVFGVPLHVRAPEVTSEERAWMGDARDWLSSVMSLLREEDSQLADLSSSKSSSEVENALILPESSSHSFKSSQIRQWRKKFAEKVDDLQTKERSVSGRGESNGLERLLEKRSRRLFGWLGKPEPGNRVPSGLDRRKVAVLQRLAVLLHQPTSQNRAMAYQIVQEAFGMFGVLALANWEQFRYGNKESDASVDSELSLLWWESGSYPFNHRIPNPLYWKSIDDTQPAAPPVLMVSRLDAPTPSHVRAMITQAMETESRGLKGTVYVDAQGYPPGPPPSSRFYDTDLQTFATRFRQASDYSVQLENTDRRFSQPNEAPDVALYVGWYRLRHYEDAFTFNPGAIGYHIASGEAIGIHNPHETGWCKNALERGITVTLGPVGEPYLDGFPLPTEFYGLLFSGRYSLVEAYYLSKRYVSWRMVLFGDPLYWPWKVGSAKRQEMAKEVWGQGQLPIPPGKKAMEFPDTQGREAIHMGKYPAFHPRILGL